MTRYRTPAQSRSCAVYTAVCVVLGFSALPVHAAQHHSVPIQTAASLNISVQSFAEGPARSAPIGLAAFALCVRRRSSGATQRD